MPHCSLMSMGTPFSISKLKFSCDKYSVDKVWTKSYCHLFQGNCLNLLQLEWMTSTKEVCYKPWLHASLNLLAGVCMAAGYTFQSFSLKFCSLAKAWQLQQLLIYFAIQKGGDVQNIMSWCLTHGSGRVKRRLQNHDGHNETRIIITADLSVSFLLHICLVRQVVGRKGGWLSFIMSPSLPRPFLAEAIADADHSIVAIVWTNLCVWEFLY